MKTRKRKPRMARPAVSKRSASNPLVRIDNWPSLLEQELQARFARPFVWGENDCCIFAASLVEAMTGVDLAAKWRGRYTKALGAGRFLKKEGGLEGLMQKLAAKHAMEALPSVLYARRGDVVLMDVPTTVATNGESAGGPALGICVGARVAAAGENGVVFVPLEQARRAWRVG